MQLILPGHGGRTLTHLQQSGIDEIVQHLVYTAPVEFHGLAHAVRPVHPMEVLLKPDRLRDILVDGNGGHGNPQFVAEEMGGGAQDLPILRICQRVEAVGTSVVVIAQRLQSQEITGVSQLSSGDVAVADIHNGMLILQGEVVDHKFHVLPKMLLQSIQNRRNQFLVLLV